MPARPAAAKTAKAASPACGIDFGTSNSAVALAGAEKAWLLPLQGESTSVPTALFFNFDENNTTFGREAMTAYLDGDDGRLLRSIKSLLGSSLFDETTQVKSRRYEFSEIIAEFLRFLRNKADTARGAPTDEVVIGRPAFFVDDDEAADTQAEEQLAAAARLAGFKAIAFQFEPIAAALAYEQTVRCEEVALVADMGGGTSDFSVVRVSPERARAADRRGDILSYNGVHIGGTDFDRLLSYAALMPHLGLRSKLMIKGKDLDAPSWYYSDLATWHRINVLYQAKVIAEIKTVLRDSAEPEKIERLLRVLDRRKGHALLAGIETAKIELSSAAAAKVSLAEIGEKVAVAIKRERLEQAIAASCDRIRTKVADCIKLAGLKPEDVATVFLTGGSSGLPAVRAAVLDAVPSARPVTGDAFGSVATGLAIDARRRFG